MQLLPYLDKLLDELAKEQTAFVEKKYIKISALPHNSTC